MMAKEIVLVGIGEPESLQIRQRELPAPAKGEVLIQIEASGVSFAEHSMRLGRYPGQPPFPFIPGYDLVGVVTELGPEVTEVRVGQRVAAITKVGGWADYTIRAVNELVPVPDGVDAVAAETAATNGLTAWQMLHRVAKIKAGQTILVHGASSGVGVLLVQIARIAGLRVIGTASSSKLERIRALGAEAIDYRNEDVVERVRQLAPDGVDSVYDNLGGKSATDSWGLLAKGGTLVSYGLALIIDEEGSIWPPMIKHLFKVYSWNTLPNGRHAYFYNLWGGHTLQPNLFRRKMHHDLTQVFDLLADGRLKAQVATVLPLEKAAEAMRLAESRTTVGKVVIAPAQEI